MDDFQTSFIKWLGTKAIINTGSTYKGLKHIENKPLKYSADFSENFQRLVEFLSRQHVCAVIDNLMFLVLTL